MDVFEDSVELVKVLLEEGIQPPKWPEAAAPLGGQESGSGLCRGRTADIKGAPTSAPTASKVCTYKVIKEVE